KTGSKNVFIDVTHLPANVITTRFPHIYRFCLKHGLDITRDQVPVAPAAHYMMGGIKTNIWGETNITGLFAAGETACTGVHGANRLASNSMLEVVVFSKRIIAKTGKQTRQKAAPHTWASNTHHLPNHGGISKSVTAPDFSTLQGLLWEKVGVIRHREGLTEAVAILAAWQKSLSSPTNRVSYERNNLVLAGRLVTEAALLRKESRGAHFRTDHPRSLPRWQRHIVFAAN
ncbi:MAG: FAD-binding protein, partial [Dehalococcoidales bacterium]|nr:FAD-binding protein [Dehalococcoidales bacterium]